MRRSHCALALFGSLALAASAGAQGASESGGSAASASAESSAGAAAAPTADEIRLASEKFAAGRAAFEKEDFTTAAEQFEAADALAPNEKALRLAMIARRSAGQLSRAASLAALAQRRHAADAELVELANEILDEASAKLHRASIRCDQPCEIVVGVRLIHGGLGTEWTVFVDPGAQEVRASWPDKTVARQSVSAVEGGASELVFAKPAPAPEALPEEPLPEDDAADDPEPEPTTEAADAEDDRRRGWSPAVFWTGAALTAGLAGVTVWSGVDTLQNPGEDAVRTGCVGQGTECELYQQGLDAQLRTNILIGVTAGVGAVTIAIGAFGTNWKGKKSEGPRSEASDGSRPTTPRGGIQDVKLWLGGAGGPTLGASGKF